MRVKVEKDLTCTVKEDCIEEYRKDCFQRKEFPDAFVEKPVGRVVSEFSRET